MLSEIKQRKTNTVWSHLYPKSERKKITGRKSIHSSHRESSRKTSTTALLTTPKPLTVWITTNWKICKELGTPDHFTCFLRNLYAGHEAIVRTGHGSTDWFQIGKRVPQGCILSPTYLTCMQSTSWEMLGCMKYKLESRLLGEITSAVQMTPPLWQEVKRN